MPLRLLFFVMLTFTVPFASTAFAEHRLGGGVNYWVMLHNLGDKGFDDNGLSYYVSYQYLPTFIGLELNVELLPSYLDETAVAPQAYVIIGDGIYAGAGIGIINSDGDFADEPFFAFKAGFNLDVLPMTNLDISANYRFNSSADLGDKNKNIDTDTVFLGAAVRFSL